MQSLRSRYCGVTPETVISERDKQRVKTHCACCHAKSLQDFKTHREEECYLRPITIVQYMRKLAFLDFLSKRNVTRFSQISPRISLTLFIPYPTIAAKPWSQECQSRVSIFSFYFTRASYRAISVIVCPA